MRYTLEFRGTIAVTLIDSLAEFPKRVLLPGALCLAGIITACGGGGGGASANVTPVADAGATQLVTAQAIVTLDGTGSTDADGSIASYRWTQVSGPNVALSNGTIATPNFTAPVLANDTELVFRLTVTDDAGATATATVSITVQAQGIFNISGIISAPVIVAVDSDTNDSLAPHSSNDTPALAQTIANPITLGGYVNLPGTGEPGRSQASGDIDDYYRVNLLADQTITMLVSDFQTNDADLNLFNGAGQFVAASLETGQVESIVVPADGEYLVNARAFSGASNYVLVIGNTGITGVGSLRTAYEFIPGQAIVRYDESLAQHQGLVAESIASRQESRIRAGVSGRQMLLELNMQNNLPVKPNQAGATGQAEGISFRSDRDRAKWETLMAIKAMRKDPLVVYAEPNYIVEPTAIPNDTAFVAQWHYPLINLPGAWDLTTGDPGVIVAVIDTGVLLNHPDLQGQLVAGYDFISLSSISGDGDGIDPNPDDPGDGPPSSFHGTHVSGTIAAASNNAVGVAGVAWNARIMPLRVLGAGGGTAYDVGQAVLYAAGLPNDSGTVPAQPADIINLSLGGGPFSQNSQDIYTAARQAGVIIVAAAGNDASSQLSYPASYDGVISVSAVDTERRLAPYSSFGNAIDVAAPGGNTRVDLNGDGFPDGVLSTGGDDSSGSTVFIYRFFNGTSMASPHVAGVIALMKSVNGNLTPAIIDQQLALGTLTDDIGVAGRDNSFGYGLINAQKAVTTALNLIGAPPPDNPILGVTPASLNFNTVTTNIEITAQNISTGNLQLNSITSGDTWITIVPGNIDANSLGTYLVTVNRTGLADGIYSGRITAQSTAGMIDISVIMSVGNTSIGGDVGFVYLLLIDADTGDVVDQLTPAASNGVYAYNFSNVVAGSYGLIAGTDADNDLSICDAGEACGAYLAIDQPIQFDVNGDLSDLNFPIGYIVALPAAAATGDATPRTGYRIKKHILKRVSG